MKRLLEVALISNPYGSVPEWVCTYCSSHNIKLIWHECCNGDDVIHAAQEAAVVWVLGGSTIISGRVLEALPNCRYVLRTGAGTDNIPIRKATELGVVVCNTPEATTDTVAEHTIGLLLAVVRQITSHDRAIRSGTWDVHTAWPDWHVTGQTLGLVGFGRIARAVAHKLSGFDMRILAYDPVFDAAKMAELGARQCDLDDLLSEADYVSLHAPLTDQTHHLIAESQLRQMKKSAILVNTSRGKLVDQAALIHALKEGWISGAGLDVVEHPPLDPQSELLSLENVVVTPHMASYDDQYWHQFWTHSLQTLAAIARCDGPLWVVNSVG